MSRNAGGAAEELLRLVTKGFDEQGVDPPSGDVVELARTYALINVGDQLERIADALGAKRDDGPPNREGS